MANFSTGGGSQIAVSAALPDTFTQAGYEALTFTDLPAIAEIPEQAARYESVTFNKLQDDSTDSVRGIANLIDIELAIYDGQRSHAGYLALKAAFNATKGTDAERIALKVVNAAGTATLYYTMRVFSMNEGPRTGNDVNSIGVMLQGPFNTRVLVEA